MQYDNKLSNLRRKLELVDQYCRLGREVYDLTRQINLDLKGLKYSDRLDMYRYEGELKNLREKNAQPPYKTSLVVDLSKLRQVQHDAPTRVG